MSALWMAVGSFQSGKAFIGRKGLTIVRLLMSGFGHGHIAKVLLQAKAFKVLLDMGSPVTLYLASFCYKR